MSLFLLPKEIQDLIFIGLSDAEAFRLQQFNLFPILNAWSFWKQRTKDRFDVPSDYFDLAIDRGISGAYRYLEILSKFEITEEAIASIDDGLVSGIYSPEKVFYLAMFENKSDLMKKILPEIDLSLFRNYSYGRSYNILSQETCRLLKGSLFNKFLVSNLDDHDPEFIQEKFDHAIVSEDWDEVRKYLNMEQKELFHFRMFVLVYSKKSGAMNIVKFYYPKLSKTFQHLLIRAVIQTGREEEVTWMSQYIPEFFTFDEDRHLQTETENPTWPEIDDYNPLVDAYFGGNLNIVNKFKKLGYDSEELNKSQLVINSYKQRMSNPIDVYYLVKEDLEQETKMGWEDCSELQFYEIDDIEILGLIRRYVDDSEEINFGEMMHEIVKETTCENLDYLNFCFSKFRSRKSELISFVEDHRSGRVGSKDVNLLIKELIRLS